jgi:PBP1b-binding outer membrane lipoprotein LpoB
MRHEIKRKQKWILSIVMTKLQSVMMKKIFLLIASGIFLLNGCRGQEKKPVFEDNQEKLLSFEEKQKKALEKEVAVILNPVLANFNFRTADRKATHDGIRGLTNIQTNREKTEKIKQALS